MYLPLTRLAVVSPWLLLAACSEQGPTAPLTAKCPSSDQRRGLPQLWAHERWNRHLLGR
jgi:hypothetical protein